MNTERKGTRELRRGPQIQDATDVFPICGRPESAGNLLRFLVGAVAGHRTATMANLCVHRVSMVNLG